MDGPPATGAGACISLPSSVLVADVGADHLVDLRPVVLGIEGDPFERIEAAEAYGHVAMSDLLNGAGVPVSDLTVGGTGSRRGLGGGRGG